MKMLVIAMAAAAVVPSAASAQLREGVPIVTSPCVPAVRPAMAGMDPVMSPRRDTAWLAAEVVERSREPLAIRWDCARMVWEVVAQSDPSLARPITPVVRPSSLDGRGGENAPPYMRR